VTHPSEENRWYQRRKFWFASGILADRRSGVDRRMRADRRQAETGGTLPVSADDRRRSPRRRTELERRSAERRMMDRRPLV
jgi:hypothetical protein